MKEQIVKPVTPVLYEKEPDNRKQTDSNPVRESGSAAKAKHPLFMQPEETLDEYMERSGRVLDVILHHPEQMREDLVLSQMSEYQIDRKSVV